jgi:hypothetical protein
MKLKMHSFDFKKCTLTFSVPKEVMYGNSFGNVPGGVDVDLVAITRNAALGTVENSSPHNGTLVPCPTCGAACRVYSGGEGTNSYEPVTPFREQI